MIERLFVSDCAVDQVARELKMTREKRRAIQNFSSDQLQRYIIDIYRSGFQDGCDAVTNRIKQEHDEDESDEVQVAWEDILKLIGEVKGVGPKILNAIDKKLKETY